MHLSHVAHLALLAVVTFTTACDTSTPTGAIAPRENPDEKIWVDLFNGRDLNNWTVKINGYPAGENAFNTFRVEDGIMQVRYDEYSAFTNQFGHIFYNGGPYSHYVLQLEYRFVGEQVNGGPAWAWRNNGIMYHAQSPQEMGVDQDFPACIEYQLLGGDGEASRTTANLCTPGTHVVINGELREDHCINSSSRTYHGDQWVTVELRVEGNQLAQHIVDGEVVMEYSGMQLDDGTPLDSGFIALQAETHPTDIRAVRLLNLEGCMDEKASNFKSYFVKHDAEACRY